MSRATAAGAWLRALAAAGAVAGAGALAQPVVPVDPALGESVVFVRSARLLPIDLETTVFRPPGEGPHPVAVINHGKDSGNNRMQPRARYLPAVREFLQRGWAVVVPMRQGFSHSGGSAVGEGCNIAANGQAQAEDVRAVVAWLEQQPWADAQRMVMLGQSHGGLTTLAYAQDPHPGFRVFVNFAGGLRYSAGGCPWETELAAAFGRYGARTRVPSLWFYGENDSFFPPAVIGPAHAAYVRAGGPAELVAFGPFGLDAHGLFGSYAGLPLWWERVAARLAAAGLPTQVLHPQFSRRAGWMARPAASGFAGVDDVERVPGLAPAGRQGYRTFLGQQSPRAFALSPDGAWGWAQGGEDPLRRALENCNRRGAGSCRLYAVDEEVVWRAVSDPAPPAPSASGTTPP